MRLPRLKLSTQPSDGKLTPGETPVDGDPDHRNAGYVSVNGHYSDKLMNSNTLCESILDDFRNQSET